MPFINDQLAHNQERLNQQSHQKFVSRFKFDVDLVMGLLKSRIIGQPHILEQLENMLLTVKADFSAPYQPLAVILLLGPTGVGKTETVKVICEAIHNNTDDLCRIDMNTLAQEHYSAALLGAPPGYVGSKEGHTLFNIEKIKGSYSRPGIVLLDEIEKADQQISRSIMNILDTGKLVLTSGQQEIDFTNSIIFMTSNITGERATNKYLSFIKRINPFFSIKTRQNKALDNALRRYFDAEFINRIDHTLEYKPLDSTHIIELVDTELEQINNRLKKKGLTLSMTLLSKKKLCEIYNREYGARDIKRIFKQKIEPLLARNMLSKTDKQYTVDWKGKFFVIVNSPSYK